MENMKKNIVSPKNQLTEKEELLLVKHSDNECTFVERFFAKRLISKNQAATDFINSLSVLSDEFAASNYSSLKENTNLWNNISKRIDQEEKAEFYLGTRSASQEQNEKFTLFDWSRINLGLSSGMVAAGLALFFTYGFFTSPSLNINTPVLATAGPSNAIAGNISGDGIRNVSLRNNSNVSSPSPAKIDWVRSHAKVRMIKDSEARLPIIWVNRSLPSARNRGVGSRSLNVDAQKGAFYGNSMQQMQSPNFDLFDVEENSNNTPIILDERAPNALNVINRSSLNNK